MDEVLIDTNILIYAHQPEERFKHERSIEIIDSLVSSGRARLSAQILGEFISATTRGPRPILRIEDALAQLSFFVSSVPVLDLTAFIIMEAARGLREYQLSYFDAQIWATARLNQIETIFTEDFTSGRRLEGVRFMNPFLPDFEISSWA